MSGERWSKLPTCPSHQSCFRIKIYLFPAQPRRAQNGLTRNSPVAPFRIGGCISGDSSCCGSSLPASARVFPFACQDGAHTKAAYRFLSNPKVKEEAILAGHFTATQSRFAATNAPILILHDTTEFTFARKNPTAIGVTHLSRLGRPPKDGRKRHHPVCGVLLHSSLAVTIEGLPLGLAAIKFWSRSEFKSTNTLKRKINPTRVPMEERESYRWLENVR